MIIIYTFKDAHKPPEAQTYIYVLVVGNETDFGFQTTMYINLLPRAICLNTYVYQVPRAIQLFSALIGFTRTLACSNPLVKNINTPLAAMGCL